MKYLIYSDCHFSQYSSIVRTRGNKYSTRLENLIKSISWAEHLADNENCDEVINLGDFFDRPSLLPEEITALQDVYFCNKPHTFITGNHDANISNLEFSSVKIFKSINAKIITSVEKSKVNDFVNFYFIPYFTESNKIRLEDVVDKDKKNIILTHNDIAGIQYGKFISTNGFEINDILDNCALFLNGHLHNGCTIQNKIVLVGNLTGQNFTEDAFKYDHCAYILEVTDDLVTLTQYVNPYAFNFYKIIINSERDFKKFKLLKSNPVISVSCSDKFNQKVKDDLDKLNAIYRIITLYNDSDLEISTNFKVDDYLSQFITFVQTKIDPSNILTEELSMLGDPNAN